MAVRIMLLCMMLFLFKWVVLKDYLFTQLNPSFQKPLSRSGMFRLEILQPANEQERPKT